MRPVTLYAAAVATLLAGCASPPTSPPPAPAAASIQVVPSPLTLFVGQTGTLTATAYDRAGVALAGTTFAWSSAAPATAGVNQSGDVLGITPGTTTVTAKAGNVQGNVTVHVLGPLTLEISPAAASVAVGQSQQFTVIARDHTGAIVPTPAITWSSGTPAVATIGTGGLALGVAPGTTSIGARSGTLIAPNAVLTVLPPAPCDGIGNVLEFSLQLNLDWTRSATNQDNFLVETLHKMVLSASLLRVAPPTAQSVQWAARPAGTASVDDKETNLNVTPREIRRVRGAGPVLATAFGAALPDFIMEVDLTGCRYRIEASPWIVMTATGPDGSTVTDAGSVGVVRTGWEDLGNWRNRLGTLEDFDAHSALWVAAGNADVAAYIPGGLGPILFVGSTGANESAQGQATVSWIFTPVR